MNDLAKNLHRNLEREAAERHPDWDKRSHESHAFGALLALATMAVVEGSEWARDEIKRLSTTKAITEIEATK
jgi:hypothetical protein